MKKFSLEAKVVISVILLALFISVIERYEMTTNITKQFIEAEKSRNTLLLNTISPIISLNLSLGLLESNTEYLDEIVKQNSDILMLKIFDKEDVIIYNYQKVGDKDIPKMDVENYFNHDIIDTVMNERLARIALYISDERYEEIIRNNTKISIEIFLITLIVLIIFIILIKKEFSFLKELTNNILRYDPKKNNFPLTESSRDDEVGIIHNAVISMVKKIHTYTHLLQKAVEEKEKTNILLAQQSKMASMGEMLASISHQWKQPLSVISAINIKLQVRSQFKAVTQEDIDKNTKGIEEQLQFITQTLKDFSDFFMPDKIMQKFSPIDSIQSIVTLFENEYKDNNININIIQKTTAEKSTILSYYNEFRQVILNILSNAKDAILQTNSSKREIDVLIASTADSIIISIQDYAGGIEVSIKDKLFNPYVTTKLADKGTGIGLYISKRIVEDSMHGKLEVKNENGGALFIITLPFEVEKHHEI